MSNETKAIIADPEGYAATVAILEERRAGLHRGIPARVIAIGALGRVDVQPLAGFNGQPAPPLLGVSVVTFSHAVAPPASVDALGVLMPSDQGLVFVPGFRPWPARRADIDELAKAGDVVGVAAEIAGRFEALEEFARVLFGRPA